MGYIRLFIELRDPDSRESGGQSRVEILDRSDREGKRYEIKVRLAAWGLVPNSRYQVALVSVSQGRYKRYVLGELQSGLRGRGDFSFRGIYGAIEEENLGAEYFDIIVVENEQQQMQGFRREPMEWRRLKDVDAVRELPSEPQVPENSKEITDAAEAKAEITENEEGISEPETVENAEAEAVAAMPEVREEGPEAEREEAEEKEAKTAEKPSEEPKEEIISETMEPSLQEPKREREGEEVQNRENKMSPAPVLKYLFSQYRKIYPFQDISRRWVRIRLEDLSMLPGEAQDLRNSSFVVRAYHRYGHLILGENGEKGYVIGIPYRYLPALKEEADSQGFDSFRSIRGGDIGYGEYGYWLRKF